MQLIWQSCFHKNSILRWYSCNFCLQSNLLNALHATISLRILAHCPTELTCIEESPYLRPPPFLDSLYFSVLGLSRNAPIVVRSCTFYEGSEILTHLIINHSTSKKRSTQQHPFCPFNFHQSYRLNCSVSYKLLYRKDMQ